MIRTQEFLDLDISVDATFFDPIANTETLVGARVLAEWIAKLSEQLL